MLSCYDIFVFTIKLRYLWTYFACHFKHLHCLYHRPMHKGKVRTHYTLVCNS